MKKYIKYILLLAPSVISQTASSSFIYDKQILVRRVNNSSGYLVNKPHVESYRVNWAAFWSAYNNVITRINSIPANYSLTALQMADTDFSFRDGNNKDEVYFSNGVPAGTAAVTFNSITETRDIFKTLTGAVIKEADIALSTAITFSFGETQAYELTAAANQNSFEEVFMHELGHGMALDHTSTYRHNMGAQKCGSYANGDASKSYVGGGMTSELQTLYGTWTGGYPDYMVSAYNRVGTLTFSGQRDYAVCSYNNNDGTPNTAMISNLTLNRGYLRNGAGKAWNLEVRQYDRVHLTFTMEATKLAASIPFKVYFSTNNIISNTDTVLYSGVVTNLGTSPYLYTIDTYIPPTTWTGYAAIGIILDPDNTLSEWSKNNNAAYWPIYVVL